MTEDPTRAMAWEAVGGARVHGRVGPADPHADPVTNPAMRHLGAAPDSPTVPTPGVGSTLTPGRGEPVVTRTRIGGLWTGLLLSAVVLVFLLIFILQNNVPVQVNFLGLSGTVPTGVALLLAAVAGLGLVAIPGGLRIRQLRRMARRGGR